jgi:hypothetical protein
LVLPAYLIELGYGAWETGAIATATLVGSALLTLAIGSVRQEHVAPALLRTAAILMMLTRLGFVALEDFWPLLLVAFVGTPASGDVSVFCRSSRRSSRGWHLTNGGPASSPAIVLLAR